ncbi:hypothetical protein DID88_001375 [Monilinia fructigena]|uniref:RNase H type-1 domain-containing protein n=1 Tax=Monilinia fructigena TaxID=38457 RepID=A0A395IYD6_9HELO|nr:hypothetical protein DID88_001375 [Monilinia fructigena]
MCTGYPPAYRRADMDVHRQHLGDMVHAGKRVQHLPVAFLECHTLIDRYKVGIKWSPGHMGIEGNEAADELANTGAKRGTDRRRSLSGAYD